MLKDLNPQKKTQTKNKPFSDVYNKIKDSYKKKNYITKHKKPSERRNL